METVIYGLLLVAIAANLALLGYFKYATFFVANAQKLIGHAGPLPEIALPIGISFFTFTQIAFLVDAHRGLAREYNFTHYALFVTYFPHLIAGPILHHREMMPQFDRRAKTLFQLIGLTGHRHERAARLLPRDHCRGMLERMRRLDQISG
jgi:D-alanyl-lipoteichoic acid acyltransferase DltB (MBOAT superfamily)